MKYLGRILLAILILIGMAILNIGTIVVLVMLQQFIFVPREYLLWTVNPPTYPLVFLILGLLDYYLLFVLGNYTKVVVNPIPDTVVRYIRNHKIVAILMGLIMIYIIFPNVTSFTETSIINRTFYNPLGTEYSYSDVMSVKTGVYGDSKVFHNNKGEYFYIVYFRDGTSVDIAVSGGEQGDDSYSMIEYIDEMLMNMDVWKVSSLENIGLLSLDQYYIDRFERIIEN